MTTPILPTKLHPPRVPADFVPLPHALERLDLGSQTPLILVSAPAGYGKSTTVSAWLASRQEPSAWLSLDRAESDLRLFVAYVVAAIRSLFPDACGTAWDLVEAHELPPAVEVANVLAAGIDEVDVPFFLVLDDYQRIESADVHALLRELLVHPSSTLRIVLTTREDPPLQLATLRAHGDLAEVRTEHLRFDRAASALLIEHRVGIELEDAVIDLLDREVEGWAVGLHLVALALQSRADLNHVLTTVERDLRAMHAYLLPEVLAGQPAGLQEWLVRTSILERFCAPLCEAVCADLEDVEPRSTGKGRAFLAAIETKGLFGVPLDARGRWYRYHHVFQVLLRQELARRYGRDEVARLHTRASEWFDENDLIEEAVHHALAAGDHVRAGRIVGRQRHPLINQEAWPRLRRLLSMLPQKVIERDPVLLVAKAWETHYFLQLQQSNAYQAKARSASESLEPGEARKLRAEVDAVRILDEYVAGDASAVLGLSEKTLSELALDASCMRGFVVAASAWAYQASGRAGRAVELVSQELERHRELGPAFHTRALLGLTITRFRDGALHEVIPLARRLIELGEAHGLLESRAFGQTFLGWAHYLRNELTEAVPHLDAVVRDRALVRRTWYAHCAFARALIYEIQGYSAEAQALAQSVLDYGLALELPLVIGEARAFRAELALRRGDVGAASEWSRTFVPEAAVSNPYFFLPHLTYARALLACGTPEARAEAAATLETTEQRLRAIHDRRRLSDVVAVFALLHGSEEDEVLARKNLNEALAIMEAGGVVRPLVTLGGPMRSLLQTLPCDSSGGAYAHRVLAAFDVSDGSSGKSLEEALTNRERDVLDLLQRRLRDKEIAAELAVSPATVKAHLRGLYKKLQVHNRREAVHVARRAGLFSED